jgi:hypothetical protein
MPCPNSIGEPVFREIFAARVVCTKYVPPTKNSKKATTPENFLLDGL